MARPGQGKRKPCPSINSTARHTIEGRLDDVHLIPVGDSGIIPRVIFQLFESLNAPGAPLQYAVKMTMLEIYNDKVHDLLVRQSGEVSVAELAVNSDQNNNLLIRGLTEVLLLSPEHGIGLLRQGSKQRQKTATLLNSSSR